MMAVVFAGGGPCGCVSRPNAMGRLLLTGLVVIMSACSAEGNGGPASTAGGTSTPVAADGSSVVYEASANVIESPEHGPVLCLGGVDDSYPPQCDGPALVGWDWATVDDEERANGSTWGIYHVVGTWDGERLTLTEPPGPAPPGAFETEFPPICDDPTGDAATDPRQSLAMGDIPDVVRSYISFEPFTLSVVARPGTGDAVTAAVRDRWAGLLCVVERDEPSRDELDQVYEEVIALPEDSPLGVQIGAHVGGTGPYVEVEVTVLTTEGQAYAEERWGDLVHLTGVLRPVAAAD
jgi:hypothetical protein